MSIVNSQLTAFGMIVHFYASVEWGVRCMLAGILETPLVEALIVTEPYSALNLKNVAKSATKLSKLDKDAQETFIQIVGDWSAFASLRNSIAHRRWEGGKRTGSIRPVGIDIRSGKAKMVGDTEDRDWLETELFAEADKLKALNERAKAFYFASGLADIIAQKDKERSEPTEA